ncbi:MAG: hypothetical protein ACRDNS_02010 [Trebonia sp.]
MERAPRDSTGLLFGRLTVLPVLVLMPFLLIGFPLLLIGYFRPIPVVVGWLALTAAVLPYVWRRIPSLTGAATWGTADAGPARPTPRWTLWALAAVAVAFGAFQSVYHSQFVIVEYDAASYMQFANWISGHGTTVIQENAQFFGGHPASITFASAAFFQVGGHVVPQFMAGLPMVLSLGIWAGGMPLALFLGPLLGAIAVFTFGGLVARLVGPRWAPFAALALGITIPMQYVSRDTWSEPLALIFLVGGLSLWIDSQCADRGQEDAGPWRTDWMHHRWSATHVLAGAAGLILGLIFLVRLDGPADILFVIPYCGALIRRRRRQAVPLIAGLIVGTLYGAVDGVALSLPYLRINGVSVLGEAALVVLMIIGTFVAVRWLRRRGDEAPDPTKPWLVRAVTALPFVVLVGSLVRPYVERDWKALQEAPLSLHMIYWFTGATVIAFAVIAVAMLGRRCVTYGAPTWTLPILVLAWATLSFLIRPAITPHFPMASRRLVPAVLPGVILFAVWLAAWITRHSGGLRFARAPRYLGRAPQTIVVAICAAGIFLPPMIGNFGLGLRFGAPTGIVPTSNGLALKQTFAGEVAAVNTICAGIPRGSAVLIINAKMMLEFGQAIRGTCDVPVAGAQTTIPMGFQPDKGNIVEPGTIVAAVRAIEDSGHRPLVLAASPTEFAPLIEQFGNGTVTQLLNQATEDDEHVLTGTPKSTVAETFTVYGWVPGVPGVPGK